MDLWFAFTLGLAGSLHCLGMCGPLALAMPVSGGWHRVSAERLLYNFGRVISYAGIGVVFGLAGKTVALAGLQRWLSIVAGVLLILGFLLSRKLSLWRPVAAFVAFLKTHIGSLLRSPGTAGMLILGFLNGLLPCGLVYVAAFGAATTAEAGAGAIYMIAFGLGTIPAMFGIGLASRLIPVGIRARLPRVIPATVLILGTLLILRGMGLGIPYISPGDLSEPSLTPACCSSHGN